MDGNTNQLISMRSKAQFKSHPIHPMLVAFPIAFLYGAAIADVVGAIGGWRQAWSQFKVSDGSVQAGPAEEAIGVYRIEDSEGEIQIIIPA